MTKKKLIVIVDSSKPDFINIPCDKIVESTNFLYGFKGDELIAMFSIGTFDHAYLSEVKE